MEEKISIILFLFSVLDLYYNYNIHEEDYENFRKARIYSDLFSLFSIIAPFLLIIFICLMRNCKYAQKYLFYIRIICCLLVLLLTIISISFQIYSIKLYFINGNNSIINKIWAKIYIVATLISILIKLFFVICDLISSIKKKKKENEEDMSELEEKGND